MKNILCLILIAALLLCLCGCEKGPGENEAIFYYPRIQFEFGSDQGVMVPEYHDVSGHTGDLRYLISLYLRGPTNPELTLPFPGGTILVELEKTETELSVVLSSGIIALDPMDMITACGSSSSIIFMIFVII